MSSARPPSRTDTPRRFARLRFQAIRCLRGCMEAFVLAMVCLSPWAFGAAEPVFEFVLDAVLAALLGLWGLRMLLEWRFRWQKCPVALCLAFLFVLGIWQLMPLPRAVLKRLSPA